MGLGKHLTAEDKQFMRENWQTMNWKEIAQALGKPHGTIRNAAMQMGLRRLPPHKPKAPQKPTDIDAAFASPKVNGAFHKGPAHMEAELVITTKTRIVRQDAPPARYAPDGPVARVVDSAECRPWAMEVRK